MQHKTAAPVAALVKGQLPTQRLSASQRLADNTLTIIALDSSVHT
jgi:hypothetical protein